MAENPTPPDPVDPQQQQPEPEPEVKPHLSFMRQPWVQNVLPLATSLALHLGIVALAFATYKVVDTVVTVVKEQIIIPDATIVEGAEVGGIPNPGLGGDPNLAAAQDQIQEVQSSEGWAEKPNQTLSQSIMGGGAGEGASESVIGIGAGGLGSGKGIGSGKGSGSGAGTGDGGGPLAPFGVPGGGGGMGPKSPFMGISGNARMVCYVCDASGSMMNKMVSLKNELKKAIDVLKPIQAFNIVFFQRDQYDALGKSLVMATPDNKRRAYDYLDQVSGQGETDPIPGLELAFKQKPQLIYLLTDGDFPDNNAVIQRIKELNKDKKVKINTIAFVDKGGSQDSLTQSFVNVLKQIAADNGGMFKFVAESDL